MCGATDFRSFKRGYYNLWLYCNQYQYRFGCLRARAVEVARSWSGGSHFRSGSWSCKNGFSHNQGHSRLDRTASSCPEFAPCRHAAGLGRRPKPVGGAEPTRPPKLHLSAEARRTKEEERRRKAHPAPQFMPADHDPPHPPCSQKRASSYSYCAISGFIRSSSGTCASKRL